MRSQYLVLRTHDVPYRSGLFHIHFHMQLRERQIRRYPQILEPFATDAIGKLRPGKGIPYVSHGLIAQSRRVLAPPALTSACAKGPDCSQQVRGRYIMCLLR